MTLLLVSMAIFIASSLLGSLNYIVTALIKNQRDDYDPLTFDHLGIFVTAIIGGCFLSSTSFSFLLLIMDRSFGTSFFLSDIFIQVVSLPGGSPVLIEHLFCFWVIQKFI